MYYQNDWLLRQIDVFMGGMARLIFNKDSYTAADAYCIINKETDILDQKLTALVKKHMLCEAEDLLFSNFVPDSKAHLLVALEFYRRLSEFDDAYLEKHDFSREEILLGLKDIARISGKCVTLEEGESDLFCF